MMVLIACGRLCQRRRRRAAAQEEPDARLQQVVGDVAIDRLMRIGHARSGIGGTNSRP